MATEEGTQLFTTLKKVLKTKGMTYLALAEKLDMAESSVKRIFANQNCSTDKLIEICSVLEVSLSQITELYKVGNIPKVEISPEVEKFFFANPHYFSFLRQLSLYKTVKEVRMRNNLSSNSTKKYILKLESFNLIKKTKNKNYEVVRSGFLQLSEKSELLKILKEQWSKAILQKSLDGKPDYFLYIASTRLKRNSIVYFKHEIEKLVDQLREQGHLENLVSDEDVQPFGISICGAPQIVDFPITLPEI